MGEEIRYILKMAEFRNVKVRRPWTSPWMGSHGILLCSTHWPLPTYQISFESGKLSADGRRYVRTDGHRNFQGLATLTLTVDRVIRHTIVDHSSTSTYVRNFIWIEKTFCGRTDVSTDGRTSSPALILYWSRPKKWKRHHSVSQHMQLSKWMLL